MNTKGTWTNVQGTKGIVYIYVERLGDVFSICIIRSHNLFCQTKVSFNGLYYHLLEKRKDKSKLSWLEKTVLRAKTGGTVREDYWLNCKEKKMKYLTVYTTSSRLPCVKSQQGAHHLRTSEQALGGRARGMVGGRKEICRALICAHLKFEFHPQGPRLLLWCWAISEYDQSYVTYNPRLNVNKQLLSFPPPPHTDTPGKGCCG